MVELVSDSWHIKRMTDEEIVSILRNPMTGEGALVWAVREALARILSDTGPNE